MEYGKIRARPLAAALGAEIEGVDLGRLDDETAADVRRAFHEFGVLFFRRQTLEPVQQIAFARRFGELDVHPIVELDEQHPELIRVHKPAGQPASFGTGWHTDNSFFAEPSLGSVLYGITIPPVGGDTLFASQEKAYEQLSPAMKQLLGGLVAVHSASRAYDPATTGEEKYRGEAPISYRYSEVIHEEVEHPVVRTHPETGRKSLYVNPMFTLRLEGMTERESAPLLEFLYQHGTQPEFTCRFRWEPGSVAFWDNRCVQHYAMDDYPDHERLMNRVTISGDRPR